MSQSCAINFFYCEIHQNAILWRFDYGVIFLFVMILNLLVNRLERIFYKVCIMCWIILMRYLNAIRPHILKLSNIYSVLR